MTNKASAQHYVWGAGCDGWHLVTNPELSVIQESMPPGTTEVSHFHEKSRQFFFVLKGRATLELNGTVFVLGVQDGLEIAPGLPHQISNQSDEPVEFLVISQPHSHGDRKLASD